MSEALRRVNESSLTIGVLNPGFHDDRADAVHYDDSVIVSTCYLLYNRGWKVSVVSTQPENETAHTPLCQAWRSLRSPALPSTVYCASLCGRDEESRKNTGRCGTPSPYPLSVVIKTRATSLPDAVSLDKFASSLKVHEDTLVPSAFARQEIASSGCKARALSERDKTCEQWH